MPGARLRIFGAPPEGGQAYLERCQAEAADLGLTGLATFEGRVSAIRDAYAAGHLFVLSSISEGFPYTLIEAMACGRASVATDVGGVSEAVGEPGRWPGWSCRPATRRPWPQACLRLLRDDTLRQTMGAAARSRVMEHFTVDRAIGAFDEMYTALGSGRGLGSPDVVVTEPAEQAAITDAVSAEAAEASEAMR